MKEVSCLLSVECNEGTESILCRVPKLEERGQQCLRKELPTGEDKGVSAWDSLLGLVCLKYESERS